MVSWWAVCVALHRSSEQAVCSHPRHLSPRLSSRLCSSILPSSSRSIVVRLVANLHVALQDELRSLCRVSRGNLLLSAPNMRLPLLAACLVAIIAPTAAQRQRYGAVTALVPDGLTPRYLAESFDSEPIIKRVGTCGSGRHPCESLESK
jgi:hypothetical protein